MDTNTALRVKYFLDHAKRENFDKFLALCSTPVFVTLGGIMKVGDEFRTRTAVHSLDFDLNDEKTRFDLNARVFPLIKRHGANPYSNMIIIGRAPNSDIHIKISGVSKMHAYLTWKDTPEGRSFLIADGKSSNGTWVSNEKLEPHKARVLKSGEVIGFGSSIYIAFYVPKDFYDALLKVRR